MASTASAAFSLTATDWPTSSRPISLARSQPNSMSLRSPGVGAPAGENAVFHEQLRAEVEGRGERHPVPLELGDDAEQERVVAVVGPVA